MAKETADDVLAEAGNLAAKAAKAMDELVAKLKELDDQKQPIKDKLRKLDELFFRSTGKFHLPEHAPQPEEAAAPVRRGRKPGKAKAAKVARPAKADGKRTRRTREQLKEDAEKMVAVLKKAGEEGASGNDLTAVAKPKLGVKLKDFIEEYAGVKVRKSGATTGTRYFIA